MKTINSDPIDFFLFKKTTICPIRWSILLGLFIQVLND